MLIKEKTHFLGVVNLAVFVQVPVAQAWSYEEEQLITKTASAVVVGVVVAAVVGRQPPPHAHAVPILCSYLYLLRTSRLGLK